MAAKTTPNMDTLQFWTKMAEDYTEFIFETTRKNIETSQEWTARSTDLMVETARKAQEWTAKEQARAMELAEESQSQYRKASEQAAGIFKDFSTN